MASCKNVELIVILKQLIKLLFHKFLLLFRSKSQYGCPAFVEPDSV